MVALIIPIYCMYDTVSVHFSVTMLVKCGYIMIEQMYDTSIPKLRTKQNESVFLYL